MTLPPPKATVVELGSAAMSNTYPVSRVKAAQEALITALEIHMEKGVFEPATCVVIRQDIDRSRKEMAALGRWAAELAQ